MNTPKIQPLRRLRTLRLALPLLLACACAPLTRPALAQSAAPNTAGASTASTTATYTNPIIPGVNLADPTVILVNGTYYLYPTTVGRIDGYAVYTSKDLVHWTRGPMVFKSGRPLTWAPDVYHNPGDGKFYLYYTANYTIGVAVADRPEGPFEDKGILVTHAKVLDAHLFRDDDGKLYLYYTLFGKNRMHVQRMETPLKKQGDPKFLFQPTQPWERKAGAINEGPWMLKHNGKYYLLYSGSGADWPDYAVGYATADSPMGPFKKFEGNPIIQRSPGIYGPGHGCVIADAAGKLWHVYHQKVSERQSFRRDLCLDPIWFDDQGVLHSQATRGTAQPAPAPQR